MIGTISELKTILGISGSGSDTLLTLLLDAASSAAKRFINWEPESVTGTVVYLDGGTEVLLLGHPVVREVTSVYYDTDARSGQASGSFPDSSLLALGTDYEIIKTPPGNVITGMRWIRGGTPTSELSWSVMSGNSGGAYGRGLSRDSVRFRAINWPYSRGGTKVVMNTGYSTIPSDMKLAVYQMAAHVYRTAANGGLFEQIQKTGPAESHLGVLTESAAIGLGSPAMMSSMNCLKRYREMYV